MRDSTITTPVWAWVTLGMVRPWSKNEQAVQVFVAAASFLPREKKRHTNLTALRGAVLQDVAAGIQKKYV